VLLAKRRKPWPCYEDHHSQSPMIPKGACDAPRISEVVSRTTSHVNAAAVSANRNMASRGTKNIHDLGSKTAKRLSCIKLGTVTPGPLVSAVDCDPSWVLRIPWSSQCTTPGCSWFVYPQSRCWFRFLRLAPVVASRALLDGPLGTQPFIFDLLALRDTRTQCEGNILDTP
jgi:hypothetical protein